MEGVIGIFVLFLLSTDMCFGSGIPSIVQYFPELKGELTKVQWSHAVNSISLLEKALSDNRVMMLEADIVLGTLLKGEKVIPIMAHPPKKTSDLSLHMFLKAVINAQKEKRKGIKLDFKSIEAFEESIKVISPLKNQLNFPVLINADILPGPVDSKVKPVDSDKFLLLSATHFPTSTLSIGWTTHYGPGLVGNYTEEQLYAMQAVIEKNKVTQPVTLCLRGGIAAETAGIKALVEKIDEYQKSNTTSITVWMSTDTDPVNISKLKDLIFIMKKSKVMLDVPKFIHDQLGLDENLARTPITVAQGALVALLTSVSTIFSNMF